MNNEDKLRQYLKRVTLDLQATRKRLHEVEGPGEPVAIVAMSCRYPGGANSPEQLWELISHGVDTIGAPPSYRGWDGVAAGGGPAVDQVGGFVESAADFDAELFGISPREALAMDPQQRLMLEASWELFERAGIAPDSLRGSRTGVFIGGSSQDHAVKSALGGSDYGLAGTASSVLSGRLSYVFGLEGPAVTIDTACSSSLVALHLAVRSVRSGECAAAVAGGATVMSTPGAFVEFSRQGGLSQSGRCKSFAAGADGTGWGEGVGLVLVETLSEAHRLGHRVLAVIRGSAVNQDGASNGLTAPNGPSQRRVIQAALADARLLPTDVDVVEAHGTGTVLGDPIEAQALLATYGQDRDRPLLLGSIKSNIGHTQSAAGVAGVIKMVLAMQHGVLPKTLHVDSPTPQVDWSSGAVELLTDPVAWPPCDDRPRRAGVSSFGASGTNSHIVLEESPDLPPEGGTESGEGPDAHPMVLSARTADALRAQAGRLLAFLDEQPGIGHADLAHALATTRAALPHRAVVISTSDANLRAGLASVADGGGAADVVRGVSRGGRVAFVFPGQGAQWVGMGRELLAADGVFAARMAECAAVMDPLTGWSLLDVVAGEGLSSLDQVDVVQPVSFAVMVSLAAVWESFGVVPDVVVGHSQGEIAAACVAGVLSLSDAVRVVVLRSRVIGSGLSGRGGMASVSASVDRVGEIVARFGERVSVAAVNGPESTVLSGEVAALDEVVAECVAMGLRARRIEVDYASHSVQVDGVAEELLAALGELAPERGRVPMYSTVRDALVDGSELDARYWVENLRAPVLFDAAVVALLEQGCRFVIEVGSHPVLVPAVEQSIDRLGASAVALGTLRRGEGGVARVLAAVGQAWAHGAVVDWSRGGDRAARRVSLPTYAFQRQRFWLEWPATAGEIAADPVDAKFWDLVESGDIRSLADLVDADPANGSDGIVAALGDWRRRKRRGAAANAWRHVDAWRRTPVSPTALSGRWLVVRPATDDADGVIAGVVGGWDPAGCVPVIAEPGIDRATLADRIRAAVDSTADLTGVVSLLALTDLPDPIRPDALAAVTGNLALAQALSDLGSDAPQWWLTRGAVRAGNDDPQPIPTHTQLWALGRVIALEHPNGWGGLIDLPENLGESVPALVAGLMTDPRGEDQIAIRGGEAFGRRLVPDPVDGELWRPRGTVLITGGTGALGGQVARWVAAHGADHVLLVSRSGESAPTAADLGEALRAFGAQVSFVACDVTDRAQLAAVLDGIPAELPLSAVVHTAGLAYGGLVSETTVDQLVSANAAKVSGAALLDELTRGVELDAFVLFSSGSASWGSAGNAVYAMGNAYLDGLALRRRASGLPATSIAWGVWGGGGMVEEAAERSLGRRGLRPMDPEVAVLALAAAVGRGDGLVTVADVDWGWFAETFTIARSSRLLSELPGVADTEAAPRAGDRELLARLRELPRTEQTRFLGDIVRAEVAAVLGHAGPEAIEPSRPFAELGFDSLTAVELRNRLRGATGLALPSTLVFDYPTVVAASEYLWAELTGVLEAEPAGPVTAVADDGDPVVIVAMSCRYPGGVESPEDLWSLVADGVDAITAFPDDRGWDTSIYDPERGTDGTTYVRVGGFVSSVTEFDAGLFGISPREALAMDPQQRLLLEASWELFERAGIDPMSLRGSRTGVFIGGSSQDHAIKAVFSGSETDGYVLTGTANSVLSGRISYVYGLEGPAVTIDTGCSSSLVALDWAVRSVRNGECEMALAGGVEVMSTPGAFVEFSRQGGLSRSGRCKSFAEGADGTGWGEGVGLLLVERLSEARRAGHHILAVVRGSSVNQDGASNGLTAPNGPSQQRVIRQALAGAGLSTTDVDVVEAHGTGTVLGDPIEAQALLATYGRGRPVDHPLWLGSIKSNIGHTQAAAGAAGVIKMVQAMRHGVLPKSLHADELTPEVDWSSGGVRVLNEARPWPEVERPRRSAVSAFGVSGTNAHVILEAFVAPEESDAPVPEVMGDGAWVLSSRTESGLQAQAARLLGHLAGDQVSSLSEIGHALAGRASLERRAVIVAAERSRFLDGLEAVAAGVSAPGVVTGERVGGRVAFVFPGQGAQWVGMGRELLSADAVFAARMAECAAVMDPLTGWSLLDVVAGEESSSLDQVDVVQPASFAVMVSLAAVWESFGVVPDVVVGHSQGEIAAACVAGVLSLSDAVRVVVLRSRVIARRLAGHGGMMSIASPSEQVRARIARYGDRVSVAALNGPESTVISGENTALDELLAEYSADGVRARRVEVDYASHSVQVDAIAAELREILAGITPQAARTPLYSTVRSEFLDGSRMDAEYWVENLRQPVQFAPVIETLLAQGFRILIEVSSHPVLLASIEQGIDRAELPAVALGTLRRDDGGRDRLLSAAAQAWAHGATVDWTAALTSPRQRRIELPTYAFQRQRFWLDWVPLDSGVPAGSPVDARFWDLVESGDMRSLAELVSADPATGSDGIVAALGDWRRRIRHETDANGWRHIDSWRGFPVSAATLPDRWLVLRPDTDDADGVITGILAGLDPARATVLTVEPGAGRAALGERIRAAVTEEPVHGVLSLLAFTDLPDPWYPEVPAALTAQLSLTQALLDAEVGVPHWCVTRGAVRIGNDDPQPIPVHTQMWALGRVAALEQPRGWGGLIDLPETVDESVVALLTALVTQPHGEDQIAVRAGAAFGRRLVPDARDGEAWRPRGTVLITGGTGALGGHVARWAAAHGAEHLLLVSRSGEQAATAPALAAELEASGVRVSFAACDIGDRASLTDVLARIPADLPLTAVVHTAGIPCHATIPETELDQLVSANAAKVSGAALLDELTRGVELDAFVLFSSGSASWGSAANAVYAMGNGYLDGLALRRRASGLPATSIAWGMWGGGGMAEGVAEEMLGRRGLRPMDPEVAVLALAAAVGRGDGLVTVADVDWGWFAETFTVARPSRLISELPGVEVIESTTSAGDPVLLTRLRERPQPERLDILADLVRAEVAAVLGHAGPEAIEPSRPFAELGFDSLTAVELRNRLRGATGLALPSTLVFDYPTVVALSEYLRGELLGESTAVTAPIVAVADDGDPVVIVAMSCRYPGGVESPEDLWSLVAAGVDAMTAFPDDRGWDLPAYDSVNSDAGAFFARVGGFVSSVTEFDAGLFGISPREALAMDPQQRLLLEASWELFERAGIDPMSLRGSRTGVFIGGTPLDHAVKSILAGPDTAGYMATSTSGSVLSGRISYVFGLEGPAVTVDTACSSSLVALDWAVRSVRSGECEMALAGGVAVLSTPGSFAEFSRQGGMSRSGRCKSFAEGADGTGWGEGVGLLLLERLSVARRSGHQVLAVVRGAAVNQDGASNGLSAPNGPSQQRVIRQALAGAGLAAADVDVVEAHGTGTVLGDPIEAQALLATYGRDRERPLLLGSIKSNIGHTQAAAGVAGVIKMVEALRHGVVPASLHVDAPSSQVDWSSGAVELVTGTRAWPEVGRPRRAGVSSFGISGTNAHVILEQVPEESLNSSLPHDISIPVLPFVLSAKTPEAVRAQAARLLPLLDRSPELDMHDLAWSSAVSRAALDHRAVVVARDRAQLSSGLRAVAEDRVAATVVRGRTRRGKVAFVFAGQGSQRSGMGRELYETFPVFATAFDEVCGHIDAVLGRSLRAVMFDEDLELSNRTEFAQPALFAFELALYRLVESWGLTADYVIGHSVGEITAACVAQVLSVADAARLVVTRGRLMQAMPAGGVMAAVQATEAEVAPLLTGTAGIAAVNGRESVVISGTESDVRCVAEHFAELGRKIKWLNVSHAFHSVLTEPILAEFAEACADIAFTRPRIGLVSNVTGGLVDEEVTVPDYWVRHVRSVVRFADGIESLVERGVVSFLELGPDAASTGSIRSGFDEERDAERIAVAAVRAGRPEPEAVVAAVATLFAHGHAVDWPDFHAVGDGVRRRIELPTYPFQRRRYWLDLTAVPIGGSGAGPTTDHPLLGSAVRLADSDGAVFTGLLSPARQPWLADHVVAGAVLLPGTAFLESALHAGAQMECDTVEELILEAPLVLSGTGDVRLQLEVGAADVAGRRMFSMHARPADAEDDPWTRHATGVLSPRGARPDTGPAVWPPVGAVGLDIDDLQELQVRTGFEFGPAFRGLRAAWLLDDQVFAEVLVPERFTDEAGRFGLHPALLDAALQPLSFLPGWDSSGEGRLPFSWNGVSLHALGATTLRVRLSAIDSETLAVTVWDGSGGPVATAESYAMRAINIGGRRSGVGESLFAMRWKEAVPLSRVVAPPVVIAAESTDAESFRDLSALAAAVDAGRTPPETVAMWLPVVGGDDMADRTRRATHAALALAQAWLGDPRFDSSRLVVVTSDAVAVADDGTHLDPANAAVWGLLRSAQTENPGRIVLLDTEAGADVNSVVAALAWTDESQLAVRAGVVHVPRLERMPSAEPLRSSEFDRGTVLITGAAGALGRLMARHLVTTRGAKHLVLVGRSGNAEDLAAELTALGADVVVAACDVADRAAVSGLLAAIPAEHPLTAVVHAAGVLDDGVFSALTPERIDTVLRPKVDGALVLHELTRALTLSEFVVFSSASGVLGGLGQANYAAANAFLDALAQHRRGLGLPATSLAWGMWAQPGGMTGQLSQADLERIERGGVRPLSAEEGLALFDAATSSDATTVVPMRLDLPRLRAGAAATGRLPELLRGLIRLPRRRETVTDSAVPRSRLLELPEDERDEAVAELVRALVAAALGYDVEQIEPLRTFQELGIDSLTAIELRNGLNTATGLRLPATLVFDHPTTAALTDYVRSEFRSGIPAATVEHQSPRRSSTMTIASLYFDACAANRYSEANEMAVSAARLRPSFTRADEVVMNREPVRLAAGDQAPVLIGFTSASPLSGPFEFSYLARYFEGTRELWVLPLPGFLTGELLPATWQALIEYLADQVERIAAGRPAILVGRSAGGTIAHSVTECLEGRGHEIAGLILLDTFEVGSEGAVRIQPAMMRQLTAQGTRLGGLDDVGLTAMTGYFALFNEWKPVEIAAPTLFVGATPDETTDGVFATWSLRHDLVRVSGTHFTLIDDGADETARVIDQWITRRATTVSP